ncbi:hypothetical protein [Brevibacterium paucivorans]|uniref:Uncharacterized protein n=1 Tax=Brevibacterium paucivorans TaxID=170994 RepID=A0A2N6VPZ4_9MICO|nr:hypothetical protein [Brevibacterium paucivorans]PMD06177.1 hypothetical protein CJ199_01990 [Brevibacterium paucivorans]
MAEQYMSRRERKEAEKRAAEAQKLKEAAETPVAEETAPVVSTPAKPQTPPQAQTKADQPPVDKEPTPAEPPQFASRAERKAWMRKHGQAPAVADEPDLTLRRQSKQEPTPAPKETEAEKAEVKKPEAQKTATKKPEAKKLEPKKPESPKSASKAAEAKKPVPAKPTTQPGVAQSAAKAPAEKKPADKKPVEKPAEQKKAVEKKTTSEKQGGNKPAAAKPAQAPQAKRTSAEEKSADSADKTSPDKKSDDVQKAAPRSRKSPVVKPPNTEGIRVVSGAVPVVSAEGKDQGDTKQDSVSADDERSRAASCATRPLESVEEDPEVTREEWPLNDEIGVAQPMSARSVTHQDGEILVGERSSVLPYIVLGVGGLCAIVLVVVALIMLF